MINHEKNSRKKLAGRIGEAFETIAEELSGLPSIEVFGRHGMAVTGCVGIIDYTRERAVIRTADGVITIAGHSLILDAFSDSHISVSGKIDDISFSDGGDI